MELNQNTNKNDPSNKNPFVPKMEKVDSVPKKKKSDFLKKLAKNPLVFLIIFLSIVFGTFFIHTLPKYKKLQSTKLEIEKIKEKNIEVDQNISKKQLEQEKIFSELLDYEEKLQPKIEKILPFDENINELTRFFESFSMGLDAKTQSGKMELNSINYGSPEKKGDYYALPIDFSFKSDKWNFVWFLEMLQKSGSLLDSDYNEYQDLNIETPIRMMRVENIQISMPNQSSKKDAEEEYDVSLKLSAFYQDGKDEK